MTRRARQLVVDRRPRPAAARPRAGGRRRPPAPRSARARRRRPAPAATSATISAAEPCRSPIWIPGWSPWKSASASGSRGRSAAVAATRTTPRRDAGVARHVRPRARRPRPAPSRRGPAGPRPPAVSSTPLRRAPQQRQPELGLEPADLLRERRLGDVERLGRAREVLVARDRREVLELPQLHVDAHAQVRDRAARLEHELARLGLPAAVPVLERARRERDVDRRSPRRRRPRSPRSRRASAPAARSRCPGATRRPG